MKKIVSALSCLILLVYFSHSAQAEPYKDKKFPSLEILAKQKWQPDWARPAEITGKIKTPEGGYLVYYKNINGGLDKMTLIMLDTDVWIVTVEGSGAIIIQK